MQLTEELDKLARACRILEMEGHGDMTLGHLSLRDPQGRGYWLKRNAYGLGEITSAADFVLVDEQSGPLSACLWLEFGHDRNGVALCWHAAARRGSLRVPEGWQAGRRWGAPAHEASILKQDCPYVTH